MNNQREVTCPLCMEAMDLTDQQFRPCKCGYQVCVWCWNHMVEESDKDEALCPACRNPYDLDRIKGMTIASDRLAEINSMEKQKLQEARLKASGGKYHPNKNRVIQRNLVYITGIPVDLSDEETLRKRGFFGQYGHILKIFVKPSKPDSPHYTKSSTVYVTFSKEEEALQCIQHVNGFILNGNPLKACYGTSRYCHAWFLKKPCKNQDCSYLHYSVPQGDICTKNDVASGCTGQVQTGSGTSLLNQRRSGSFLPSPADCSVIAEKPLVSSITHSHSDCGRDLRSSSIEKIIAPSRADSWSAVYEEPFTASSKSYTPITSPTGTRSSYVSEQAQDGYQNKDQILTQQEHIVPNIEASHANNIVMKNTVTKSSGLIERIMPELHRLDSSGFKPPTSIASNLTEQESSAHLSITNRVNRDSPPFTSKQDIQISNLQSRTLGSASTSHKEPPSNSTGFKWLTPITADSTAQASSSGIRSTTNRVDHDPRSFISKQDSLISNLQSTALSSLSTSQKTPLLDSIGFKQTTPIADLTKQASSGVLSTTRVNHDSRSFISKQDSLVSNLQSMALSSASAFQKEPPLESMKLTSRSEANPTSLYSEGIDTCDTGSTIGQKVSEVSNFPDNVTGTSFHEQKLLTKQGLKSISLHANEGVSSATESVNESKHLPILCRPASKPVISPAPKFPPGFPLPRNTSNASRPCINPPSSGNALVNSSTQNLSKSNSYFSVEPIDAMKRYLEATATSNLVRSDDRSNAGSIYDNNLMQVDQSKFNYLNPTQMALYQPHPEAYTYGSPLAADSQVIGRRPAQPGLIPIPTTTGTGVFHYQKRSNTQPRGTDLTRYYYYQPR